MSIQDVLTDLQEQRQGVTVFGDTGPKPIPLIPDQPPMETALQAFFRGLRVADDCAMLRSDVRGYPQELAGLIDLRGDLGDEPERFDMLCKYRKWFDRAARANQTIIPKKISLSAMLGRWVTGLTASVKMVPLKPPHFLNEQRSTWKYLMPTQANSVLALTTYRYGHPINVRISTDFLEHGGFDLVCEGYASEPIMSMTLIDRYASGDNPVWYTQGNYRAALTGYSVTQTIPNELFVRLMAAELLKDKDGSKTVYDNWVYSGAKHSLFSVSYVDASDAEIDLAQALETFGLGYRDVRHYEWWTTSVSGVRGVLTKFIGPDHVRNRLLCYR